MADWNPVPAHVDDYWMTHSALQNQCSHLSGDLVLTW